MIPKISFKHYVPINCTMIFETKCFEPELRISFDEKQDIISNNCKSTWLFINDKTAGEIYTEDNIILTTKDKNFVDIYDSKYYNLLTAYVHSCAILPKFQGKGYGRLLYAYHLGYLKANNFSLLIGHSTSPEMDKLNKFFNAKFIPSGVHKNWYGTKRTAKFYEIAL
jgi:GNAT superfamily N-acetyltransferase